MRPRILRIGTVGSFGRNNIFKSISQRQDILDPLFKILAAFEGQDLRDSLKVFGLNGIQRPEKLNETRMFFRRSGTRSPEISFTELFRRHLKIVE